MNIKNKIMGGLLGAAMLITNFNCALAAETLPFTKVANNFFSMTAFSNARVERTVGTYYSAYDGEAVKFDGDGLPEFTLADKHFGPYIGNGMLKISGTTPDENKVHTVRNRALSLPLTLNSGTKYKVQISYITAYGNAFSLVAADAGQYFVGSTGQIKVTPAGWTRSTAEGSFTPTSNDVDISLLDWNDNETSFILYIDEIKVSDNSGNVVYSDDFENYAVAGEENPGGGPSEENPDQPQPVEFGIEKVTGEFKGQQAFEITGTMRKIGTYYSPYVAKVVQFNYDGFPSFAKEQKKYDDYIGQYMLKIDRKTPTDHINGTDQGKYRALSIPIDVTPGTEYTVKVSHIIGADQYILLAGNAGAYYVGASPLVEVKGGWAYAVSDAVFTPTADVADISLLDWNKAGSSGVMYIDKVEVLDSNGNSVYCEDFAPASEHCVGNLVITDADGNNIDNLSEAAGIKARAEFTNTSQSEAKYMIIASIYNADKKLVKACVQNVTVPAGSVSEPFYVTVNGAAGEFNGCTAKAFVWNDSLSPKCAAVTK